jgi:hypothetical protein
MTDNKRKRGLKSRFAHVFERDQPEYQHKQAMVFFIHVSDNLLAQSQLPLLTDELHRQVFAGYLFGMLQAYGRRLHMAQPTLIGIITALLTAKLGYNIQAADRFAQELVNASEPDYRPAWHVLIERGAAGLLLWEGQGMPAVSADLAGAVQALREARKSSQ